MSHFSWSFRLYLYSPFPLTTKDAHNIYIRLVYSSSWILATFGPRCLLGVITIPHLGQFPASGLLLIVYWESLLSVTSRAERVYTNLFVERGVRSAAVLGMYRNHLIFRSWVQSPGILNLVLPYSSTVTIHELSRVRSSETYVMISAQNYIHIHY